MDPKKKLVLVAPNARALSQAHDIMNGFLKMNPEWNISIANSVRNKLESDDNDETDIVDEFVYEFKGCNALIVDNVINSGLSLATVSETLKAKGASSIYAYTPTGLFSSKDSLIRLYESPINEILVTDTVLIDDWKKRLCPKITEVSIAKDIAEIIKYQHYIPKIPYE